MRDDRNDTRRARKRFAAKLEVRCHQVREGETVIFSCLTNDISEFGMQIVTLEGLDTTKSLMIDFMLPYPLKSRVSAMGRIRWRKDAGQDADGAPLYRYGVSFENMDTESRESLFKYLFFISDLGVGGGA